MDKRLEQILSKLTADIQVISSTLESIKNNQIEEPKEEIKISENLESVDEENIKLEINFPHNIHVPAIKKYISILEASEAQSPIEEQLEWVWKRYGYILYTTIQYKLNDLISNIILGKNEFLYFNGANHTDLRFDRKKYNHIEYQIHGIFLRYFLIELLNIQETFNSKINYFKVPHLDNEIDTLKIDSVRGKQFYNDFYESLINISRDFLEGENYGLIEKNTKHFIKKYCEDNSLDKIDLKTVISKFIYFYSESSLISFRSIIHEQNSLMNNFLEEYRLLHDKNLNKDYDKSTFPQGNS